MLQLAKHALSEDLVKHILSFLDATHLRQIARTCTKAAGYGWKSGRCTLAAQARTLSMFQSIEGIPLDSALALKLTKIVGDPARRKQLQDWIVWNRVRIDQGGFYIQNTPDIHSWHCYEPRVRLLLWENALYKYSNITGPHPLDTVQRTELRQAFTNRGYVAGAL